MNFNGHLIDGYCLVLGQLVFWPFVAVAFWKAFQQNKGIESKKITHILPALCTGILLAWQLKATLSIGISIHLLGATILTVLFGWPLAVIGLMIVLVATILIQEPTQLASWQALGLNGVLMIIIPALVSYGVVRLVFSYLPKNVFIYIFLSGFANAMLTIGAVGLASTGILVFASEISSIALIQQYLPAYLLILFPEAFTTGAILTMFVVYYPDWVLSFDDKRYLKK